MNFKLNLWTLLFAISTALLIFIMQPRSGWGPQGNCACLTEPLRTDSIPKAVFDSRYHLYESKCLPDLGGLNAKLNIVNMNLQYFKLDSHEISQLYFFHRLLKNKKVYVYPVLKGNGAVIDTLDYVFYLPDSTGHKGSYFDFTAPCPTLCNE